MHEDTRERRTDSPTARTTDSPTTRTTDSSTARTTLRTPAERDTFGVATYYAAVEGLSTPAEAAYLSVLPGARLEILHRFVGLLLRESTPGVAPHELVASVEALRDVVTTDDAVDTDDVVAAVASVPDWRQLAVLPFLDAAATLVIPLAAVHGFDRFEPTGPLLLVDVNGVSELDHPSDLVALLDRDGLFARPDLAGSLDAELAESTANLALSRLSPLARATRGHETSGTAGDAAGDDDPLTTHLASLAEGADLPAALERLAAVEERPTHPSAKIRRGAGPGDALAYAPEFSSRIPVRFVALHTDSLLEAHADDEPPLSTILLDTFAGLADALRAALPPDADPSDFHVLPVHPWQYHHVLPVRYADALADGRIVPLSYVHDATPLLNFRTVVPVPQGLGDAGSDGSRAPPHLKLPVGIQKTNHLRTLPAEEVSNGPRAAQLVAQLVRAAELDGVGILRDRAAACYLPAAGPAEGDAKVDDGAAHLGAVVRENPADHPLVPSGGTAIVGASLLAPSPATGRPLVCTLVDRLARSRGESSAAAARRFFEAYLHLLVPAQLRLAYKYGVALESHLQNVVVVVDGDGLPVGALVRDFGGIRVLAERLHAQGFDLSLYPGSDLEATIDGDLDRKTVVSFYQLNLAELVAVVSTHTALDERTCWELVRVATHAEFAALRRDPAVPDAWLDRDETVLFAGRAAHLSRLEMRLRGLAVPPYDSAMVVVNPLASWPPRAGERGSR